jgi:hypothetical protein
VVLDSQTLAVRGVEDSELDEVAIRSDPAPRVRQSPKVRVVTNVPSSCAQASQEAADRILGPNGTIDLPSPRVRSTGLLRVHLGLPAAPDNLCAPSITTGYYGRLNHTIKVLLTSADRFVWGYRNGEGLYRATLDDDTTIRMITPFRDSAAYPLSNQIVELLAWDSRLPNGEVTAVSLGRFHSIATGYRPDTDTLTLETPVDADLRAWYDGRAAAGEQVFLFLRFWEEPPVENDTSIGTALNVPLAKTGIFVDFLDAGRPGDQWTFSVRGNANDTVFPKRMLEPGGQPPEGIRRSLDLIALIHWRVRGGAVAWDIHDCRRRVRPLWKQRGCCTFTVGNGLESYGDYDRLSDALAALPHEGGRICLLPGIHDVEARLHDLSNVTIEGCGRQTVLRRPGADADTGPVLTLRRCRSIRLRDFTVDDGRRLAIAGARNEALALERISTRGRGSALSLVGTSGLRIVDCDFYALAEPAVVPPEEFPELRPLAFVGGSDIVIRNSKFRCEDHGLPYLSLGGLQIASNSRHVRIEDNLISAGLGHGITFGHLNRLEVKGVEYSEADKLAELAGAMSEGFEKESVWAGNTREASMDGQMLLDFGGNLSPEVAAIQATIAAAHLNLFENEFGISNVAVQGCVGIDPTPTQPEPDPDDDEWVQYFISGEIRHVHVVGNEIVDMGGSGVSIPSWNVSQRARIGENIVRELVMTGNHIRRCARIAIASTLPDAELQEIGFGGVALEHVEATTIADNVIEEIGGDIRSPTVGIYVSDATGCTIRGNLITAIGRIERPGNLNVLGVQGGIVIDDCAPFYGPPAVSGGKIAGNWVGKRYYEKTAPAIDLTRLSLPRGEALRIVGNQVIVNFGHSLDVRGKGSFYIADNSFVSLASRSNEARSRIANGLSVVNTDVPFIEFVAFLFAILFILLDSLPDEDLFESILLSLIRLMVAEVAPETDLGTIRFHDNLVRSEDLAAGEISIAQHAIITAQDLLVSDNVFKTLHRAFSGYINLYALGLYSTQCVSNRFDSRVPQGVLAAAVTVGMMNSTYLNHGSHRIEPLGPLSADLTGSGNLVF